MLGFGGNLRFGLSFHFLNMNGSLGRMRLVVGLANLLDFRLRPDDDRLGRAMRLGELRGSRMMPRVKHDRRLGLCGV